MRLRAMLGRAAAVLSIAAVGAAVAAPAQAVAYDRYLTVSLTVPDDAPDVFDGLTFEIFGPFGEPVRDAMFFWRKTRAGGGQALYANWVRGPSPHTITATSEWIDLAVVASGAREMPQLPVTTVA